MGQTNSEHSRHWFFGGKLEQADTFLTRSRTRSPRYWFSPPLVHSP
jgi:hypothetical protein